jgi:hypothetical protein
VRPPDTFRPIPSPSLRTAARHPDPQLRFCG